MRDPDAEVWRGDPVPGGGTERRVWGVAGSLAAFVVLWSLAAWLAASPMLPGPWQVGRFMVTEARTGALWVHMGATLLRVLVAFVLAMALGTALGLVMGLWRRADRIFDPWLVIFLNIPALVVIILAYIWLGLVEVAAVLAVAINKIPNVCVTVREGVRGLDADLSEMAVAYRLGWFARLRHLILPQLAPFLAAAVRSGISLIWKIVLVVELLGRSNGIGFQLHLYFQLFDIVAIIGYGLAFAVVMQVVELVVLQPLDRHVNRWRRADGRAD